MAANPTNASNASDLDTATTCVLAYPASALHRCRRIRSIYAAEHPIERFVPTRRGAVVRRSAESFLESAERMSILDLVLLDRAHLAAIDAAGGPRGDFALYCVPRDHAHCVEVVDDGEHRCDWKRLRVVEERALIKAMLSAGTVTDLELATLRRDLDSVVRTEWCSVVSRPSSCPPS
jgi:hypothetical protein